MKLEIKLDDAYTEPKVIVLAAAMTEEVNALVQRLSESAPQMIAGFRGDTLHVLEQTEIFRVYTDGGKVLAATDQGIYTLRMRLYELEERLDKTRFVRISNAEIINLKKVKNFDLNIAGSICVSLLDGSVTYVSRRYVAKIKQVLGV